MYIQYHVCTVHPGFTRANEPPRLRYCDTGGTTPAAASGVQAAGHNRSVSLPHSTIFRPLGSHYDGGGQIPARSAGRCMPSSRITKLHGQLADGARHLSVCPRQSAPGRCESGLDFSGIEAMTRRDTPPPFSLLTTQVRSALARSRTESAGNETETGAKEKRRRGGGKECRRSLSVSEAVLELDALSMGPSPASRKSAVLSPFCNWVSMAQSRMTRLAALQFARRDTGASLTFGALPSAGSNGPWRRGRG